MNFRAFGILIYLIYFLITKIPQRNRLKKLSETDPEKGSAISHDQVKKAFRRVLSISGVKVETEGLENIPEEPVLFVGNHNSYFDILVTEEIIPSGAGYVSKDSLKKIPLLAPWMELLHCLFLNRENVREGLKTIMTGADYLKNGYNRFIFPEGTRSKNGKLGEFKGGSLKMAQKADAPIIPVAISGTSAIFEKNEGLRITPQTVHVSFGTPFKISDLPKEKRKFAADYTKAAIQEMLDKQK